MTATSESISNAGIVVPGSASGRARRIHARVRLEARPHAATPRYAAAARIAIAATARSASVTSIGSTDSAGSYIQYDGTKKAITNASADAAGSRRRPNQTPGAAVRPRPAHADAITLATTQATRLTAKNQASASVRPCSL
jgi:hypothetical protein